ncbi:hypothetical protein [Egicoccus halophilus]|nr:hypothetical protein [Egicoccus halophilus]
MTCDPRADDAAYRDAPETPAPRRCPQEERNDDSPAEVLVQLEPRVLADTLGLVLRGSGLRVTVSVEPAETDGSESAATPFRLAVVSDGRVPRLPAEHTIVLDEAGTPVSVDGRTPASSAATPLEDLLALVERVLADDGPPLTPADRTTP